MPPKAAAKLQGKTESSDKDVKPVARAACLACRIAKRRCDGIQPHCGPCQKRGLSLPPPDMPLDQRAVRPNSTTYCVFVASKRGGPRYKGVMGAENELVKLKRDAEKARKQASVADSSASTYVFSQGGTEARGTKRERSIDQAALGMSSDSRARSDTTCSISSSSTANQGRRDSIFEAPYQMRGNDYEHQPSDLPDAFYPSGPTSKKAKHQGTESERIQDSRIRDQAKDRARIAALNAQQSFQQSRMHQNGSRSDCPFPNLDVTSDFNLQSRPISARQTSATSYSRTPADELLELAEMARKETMSIAKQRPDLFESGKVGHGTQSFGKSQPPQDSTSAPFRHTLTQEIQHSQSRPGYRSLSHRHDRQDNCRSQQSSHSGQSSNQFPPSPPRAPIASFSAPQFNDSQVDQLPHSNPSFLPSHNHPIPQLNPRHQSRSSSHFNPHSSTASGHPHFHPFALPSPLHTSHLPSPTAVDHAGLLTPLRNHDLQTSAMNNFPQSSSRESSTTASGGLVAPHLVGPQNPTQVRTFNGTGGSGGGSASDNSDPSAHALSSANLDLWQRLQRESEGDGYGQDTFAQLYPFGGDSNINIFPNESLHQNQTASRQYQQQQQSSLDQRELFSLDINMPIEMNTDLMGNILGQDFDITMDMFNSFYNKIENLPKAGVHQNVEDQEEQKRPSRKERSRKAGDKNGNRSGSVDEETRARTVLSVFFENVYPTCPVLLPSSSLSSLAFYFTEKSLPCALWASISACAALHMGDDAYKTLRKGAGKGLSAIRKMQTSTLGDAATCVEGEESEFSDEAEGERECDADDPNQPSISAVDIAAHHARTAEWLLRRYTDLIAEQIGFTSSNQQQRSFNGEDLDRNSSSTVPSLSPSSTSTASQATGGTTRYPTQPEIARSSAASRHAEASICSLLPDLGLVAIEATAAKTLLAHYYYGGASGEGDSRKRAWEMAKEAWKGAADLELWDEGWEKEKAEARKRAEAIESTRASSAGPATALSYNHQGSSLTLAELIHLMKQEQEHKAASELDQPPSHVPSPESPFSRSQRIEWARRTFWCAYEAATVMTATGGYCPKAVDFPLTSEAEQSLHLRPGVGSLSHRDLANAPDLKRPPTDRGWATMIKGAQLVSRAYRSLYQLDELNREIATKRDDHGSTQHSVSARRSRIFEEMLALDEDIGGFLNDDSSRSTSEATLPSSASQLGAPANSSIATFLPEQELHRALSVSGTLMAAGATIILHRAQAYGRARLFMQPNCCVPRQSENNDTGHQYKAAPFGFGPEVRRPSMKHGGQPKQMSDRAVTAGMTPELSSGASSASNGLEEQASHAGYDDEDEIVPASAPIPSSFRLGEGLSTKVSSKPPISRESSQTLKSAATSIANTADASPQLPDTFFSGGPFLPSHSFNRCRSAAETMARALKPILNELLRNIEVDEMLEVEETTEEATKHDHAPQINSSPKISDLSLQDRMGDHAHLSFAFQHASSHGRESSTIRAQKALAMLNSADDSKRRAIIKKAPKLPPFSACSCVLGAYVLLMQSLAVKINSGAATPALDNGSPLPSPSLSQQRPQPQQSSLRSHADSLKTFSSSVTAKHPASAGIAGDLIAQFGSTANDFSRILDFFSTVWPIASDYKEELSALLAANESLR